MKISVYTCINIWMSRTSSRWRKREREWCSHWQWIGFLSNPAVSVCSQVSQTQHTTTHCNSLQLTGVFLKCRLSQDHCDPLQLTATHCNPLHLTAIHCNSQQLTATRCNPLEFHSSVASCTRLCLISCVPHTHVCVCMCVWERERVSVCVCVHVYLWHSSISQLSLLPNAFLKFSLRGLSIRYMYTHTQTHAYSMGWLPSANSPTLDSLGAISWGVSQKRPELCWAVSQKRPALRWAISQKRPAFCWAVSQKRQAFCCAVSQKRPAFYWAWVVSRGRRAFFLLGLSTVLPHICVWVFFLVLHVIVCVYLCVCVCVHIRLGHCSFVGSVRKWDLSTWRLEREEGRRVDANPLKLENNDTFSVNIWVFVLHTYTFMWRTRWLRLVGSLKL